MCVQMWLYSCEYILEEIPEVNETDGKHILWSIVYLSNICPDGTMAT